MVEPDHPVLTIKEQCRILSISRSAYYYTPEQKEDERDIAILQAILEELREYSGPNLPPIPMISYQREWKEFRWKPATLERNRWQEYIGFRCKPATDLVPFLPRRNNHVSTEEKHETDQNDGEDEIDGSPNKYPPYRGSYRL